MAESGYPEYGVSVWYGVSAPAKLPDDIAQKITASLNKALTDDAFRASLDKVGFPPLRPKSQAEIDKFVETDRARWAGVIKHSTSHWIRISGSGHGSRKAKSARAN
jgi:tripartite-type tricarboxylate transporter receptor subunit TctC